MKKVPKKSKVTFTESLTALEKPTIPEKLINQGEVDKATASMAFYDLMKEVSSLQVDTQRNIPLHLSFLIMNGILIYINISSLLIDSIQIPSHKAQSIFRVYILHY